MMRRFYLLGLLAAAFSVHAYAAQPALPDWVLQAASAPYTAPQGAKAAVLLEDNLLTIQPDGQAHLRHREVIKILRPQGREYGELSTWSGMGEKLLAFHVWSIGPDGHQYTVKNEQIRDVGSNDEGMLYMDYRGKAVTPPGADPGGVVADESESLLPGYREENSWFFQGIIPVHRAVFEIDLPAGWKQKALWHQHEPQQPQEVAPGHWRWELQDIAPLDLEDVTLAPSAKALAGRMVVHFGSADVAQGDQLWANIGSWYSDLSSPRTAGTGEISARAQELAAKESDFTARIEAIAEFLQRDIRYVGIEMGIGGFQPHAAADVFHNRYGDCKDKATLLIAMLNAIGVHATYVLVDTSRGFIDARVPSIDGNHAIAAIQLPDGYNDARLKTVVKAKTGKRFLIFDPTNQYVPIGLLPTYLQGSYGTLVDGKDSQVIELPFVSPDADVTERIAKFELDTDGTLQGTVTETRMGASAGSERRYFAVNSEKEQREFVERRLRQDFSSFQLASESAENSKDLKEKFVVKYKISAPAYARPAGNLLLVRPRVVGSDAEPLNDKMRMYPIDLRVAGTWRDSFDVKVPSGYIVDELPDPVKVDEDFASYRSEVKAEGDTLHYSRELVVKQVVLKPDAYEKLRKLEAYITTDESRSAVLKKQ